MQDEYQQAQDQWTRYARARDAGHRDYIEESRKFDAFYYGDQWSETDRQALESAGRPALTINQILPAVNTVLGEQAANRAELNFKPRRRTDKDTAVILNKLVRYVLDDNQYDWKESEIFADGVIADRGYLDIRINFTKNAFGEIDITPKDNADIIPDPDAKSYDPDEWKEVFETRWVSLDDIAASYGKAASDKVRAFVGSRDSLDPDGYRFRATFGDTSSVPDDAASRDKALRAVRLVERQHKKLHTARVFIAPQGDIREVPDAWTEARAEAHAQEQGYQIIEQQRMKVRWTVTAGDVLLHDDWSPYSRFTIVPYFPYYRRGRPFGMVRNLISPQEQLNKLSSQELHIVNTTANSGWMIEEGSLADGMTYDDIERQGAKTGLVLRYNPGTTPPHKIQPNQVPTGIDRLSMKSQVSIRDISGIHQAMQGNAGNEMSGRALQAQITRGQVQVQKPLDNLARTRYFTARLILELIQTYYTEERVLFITNDLDPDAEDEELVINQRTVEGIVNDVTLGEYSIIVSQQPSTDSYQDSQFNEAMQLAQAGVPIPPHVLVEYSHLARRTEIAEMLKQQAGMSEPSEEEAEMLRFQQQAQMEDIRLELGKKQAELQKLMAETGKISAETETESDPEATQNQLRIMELQADVQKHLQQLQARVELAEQSYRAQKAKQRQASMVQVRQQDMQQETQISTAVINADRTQTAPQGE